jgi:hypothetical protein
MMLFKKSAFVDDGRHYLKENKWIKSIIIVRHQIV